MPSYDVANIPQIAVTRALFDPDTSNIEIDGIPTDRHHAAALLGVLVFELVDGCVLTPDEALQIAAHGAGII